MNLLFLFRLCCDWTWMNVDHLFQFFRYDPIAVTLLFKITSISEALYCAASWLVWSERKCWWCAFCWEHKQTYLYLSSQTAVCLPLRGKCMPRPGSLPASDRVRSASLCRTPRKCVRLLDVFMHGKLHKGACVSVIAWKIKWCKWCVIMQS